MIHDIKPAIGFIQTTIAKNAYSRIGLLPRHKTIEVKTPDMFNDSIIVIEWHNGYGFYYLNGVEFDEETWGDIVEEKITLKTLGNITNADQRAVAVQMLRPDRLLEQVKAELINVGQKGTELYQVPNFMDTGKTEYCMKMEHPSIKDKFYIEWVEPRIGIKADADLAQAVAFGFTKEQYLDAEEA